MRWNHAMTGGLLVAVGIALGGCSSSTRTTIPTQIQPLGVEVEDPTNVMPPTLLRAAESRATSTLLSRGFRVQSGATDDIIALQRARRNVDPSKFQSLSVAPPAGLLTITILERTLDRTPPDSARRISVIKLAGRLVDVSSNQLLWQGSSSDSRGALWDSRTDADVIGQAAESLIHTMPPLASE